MLPRLSILSSEVSRIQPCVKQIFTGLHKANSSTVHSLKSSLPNATCPVHAFKSHVTCYHTINHWRNTDFEDKDPQRIMGKNVKSPKWHLYNDVKYEPTAPGEPQRPAEICHSRFQIKYSTKKLWYIAAMIRGMSIDEAIKQLSFHKRKGAAHVKEVLEEAQEMALEEHNVEFKSNLWISDAFATKGIVVKA